MTKALCSKCRNVIIKDYDKWKEETTSKYIQCPFCGYVMEMAEEKL